MQIRVQRVKLLVQVVVVLSLIFSMTGAFNVLAAPAKASYQYYVVGNASDVSRSTTAGQLLMGGGTDVDAAFQWMIGKAGGGDFVVIRATGTDAYNPYIYGLGTVDSVETIITKNRAAASDPFVVAKIRSAEALFIAGGDQNDYLCHLMERHPR